MAEITKRKTRDSSKLLLKISPRKTITLDEFLNAIDNKQFADYLNRIEQSMKKSNPEIYSIMKKSLDKMFPEQRLFVKIVAREIGTNITKMYFLLSYASSQAYSNKEPS